MGVALILAVNGVDAPARVQALVVRDPPIGGHERITHEWVARSIARVMQLPYAEASDGRMAATYFVPDDTLDEATAISFGINGADQLFGGIVPHAFVATKAIVHPLREGTQAAVAGWAHSLAPTLAGCTLPGYTAFCAPDARSAYLQLAQQGRVRLKLPTGVGGQGQWLLEDAAMLDVLLAGLPGDYLASHGIVLETHLARLQTFSVGQVDCAGHSIAYHGTQVDTRARSGQLVYGGSDLEVVRGTLDDLLAGELAPLQRRAVEMARTFDRAVHHAFPGLRVSRRNYDVACGEGEDGRPRCGVLEQSWRIGGATPAELVALAVLIGDRRIERVRAGTRELHGGTAPPGARVYCAVDDPRVGPLVKYLTLAHD